MGFRSTVLWRRRGTLGQQLGHSENNDHGMKSKVSRGRLLGGIHLLILRSMERKRKNRRCLTTSTMTTTTTIGGSITRD